jgi:VIT1/CCC1 family predicted Fe2+/Mn2+ transporter
VNETDLPAIGPGVRTGAAGDRKLGAALIRDELFDLSLYTALRDLAAGDLRATLDELIRIELRHFAFWQEFFQLVVTRLDVPRRIKLAIVIGVCRLFGEPAIRLVLEAIEVYGVRKYLGVWEKYKDSPLGEAVRTVLEDELHHEDVVVSGLAERRINPERIRNLFLGLNDGLVEIVGAVGGFFGAFGKPGLVLLAASTTAVAGSISMAAGAYVATSSEREVARTERGRKRFLEGADSDIGARPDSPLLSSILVGSSYLAGALVPVLPVLFGSQTVLVPMITAGVVVVLVSLVVAFLSGMAAGRRVVTNLIILTVAAAVTYGLGTAVKRLWGIAV